MNIFKITTSIATVILSCLTNIPRVNAYDCINLESLQLCDNINVCPDNYHLCNSYDADILIQNEKYFNTLNNSYITNIGSNGNECGNCNVNPYYKLLSIEPEQYNDIRSVNYENACLIDNKVIKENEGIMLSNCMVCMCKDTQTQCIDICSYNNIYKTISTFENTITNCIGLNQKSRNPQTCNEINKKNKMTNIACCQDNSCVTKNCKSCVRYGNREECNLCESGYYFNSYSKNKCHSVELIQQICDFSYILNDITQVFTCAKCDNGFQMFNNITNKYECVCNDGYYGETCQYNYNVRFCLNNGYYDIENKYCVCDEDFYGENCEINIFHSCKNGYYNKQHSKCICHYGFTGEKCDNSIECYNGQIKNNVCVCNEGFSGSKCNIMFPENTIQRENKYKLLNSYYNSPCKNGMLFNNTCICENGYTGQDCGKSICNYGTYDVINDVCLCVEGYYGNNCDFNCYEQCSYNGNICTDMKECVCNNGWYGDKCHLFKPTTGHNTNINIGGHYNIPYTVQDDTYNFSIELLLNILQHIVPFKITTTAKEQGTRRLTSISNNDNILLNTSLGIMNDNDYYYIYPNNNYNDSYLSGKIINITVNNIHEQTNYYIYIEPLRSSDFIYVNYSQPIIYNNTSTINNTDIEITNNNTDNDDNEYGINKWFLNMYVIGSVSLLAFIIITSIIVKKYNSKKRTGIILRLPITTNDMIEDTIITRNNINNENKVATINNENSNNRSSPNRSSFEMSANPIVHKNKVQYAVNMTNNKFHTLNSYKNVKTTRRIIRK